MTEHGNSKREHGNSNREHGNSNRELIVLGTGSQAPTRFRNHNGYALRWDDQLLVFDPGEGFQRQCLLANLSISRATGCFITHFHGDHSLGLPGFLQRRALDGANWPLPIWFPSDGETYLDRLRTSTIWNDEAGIQKRPMTDDGDVGTIGNLIVSAKKLDHRVTTFGYRVQEPDSVTLDAGKLAEANISGPEVGVLKRDGQFQDENGTVHLLPDFSRKRSGQSMAFIMDTRLCDAAFELAEGVDLLVCESTYLETESQLASDYAHLTARQAGQIASEAGARRLVLTHFSQRHPDSKVFVDEASAEHGDVVAASDLGRISVPLRLDA